MAFHDETSLYRVIGPDDKAYGDVPGDQARPYRYLIYVTYGRNGGATARSYMTGDKMGRANGGGWDITGGALIDAVCKRWPQVPRIDGAAGYETIKRHCAKHGVEIVTAGEMLWGK